MVPSVSETFGLLKGRIRKLAADLWQDDCGAGLSVECVLVTGVLVIGLVPGLVAARHSISAGHTHGGHAAPAAAPAP